MFLLRQIAANVYKYPMELNRYIFKKMANWLAGCTLVLISIVWLSQASRQIELLVNKGAGFKDFFTLMSLAIPYWLILALPMSGFAATMFVSHHLKQDREITAMRAAGLSNFYIARAPITLGLAVTGLLYLNSIFFMPLTFAIHKTTLNDLRASAPIVTLQEGVFVDFTKGLTVFIDERDGAYSFKNIFVHDSRNSNKTIEIVAERGTIILNTQPPQMLFYNGTHSEYTLGESRAAVFEFDTYNISIAQKSKILKPRPTHYNEMSIATLLGGKANNEHRTREMHAEGHYRLASPLLGIALMMIGIAASLRAKHRRTGQWWPICIGTCTAIATVIALIVVRGLTIASPQLFILIYLVPIIATGISAALLHEKSTIYTAALS